MSTPSPVLGIPLHQDPDVVSTTSLNEGYVYLDTAVQHRDITARPFEVRTPLVYNAGSNRIEVTFGPGRAYFGAAMVEKLATWLAVITGPLPGRTYAVFLLPDGSTTSNLTGVAPAGAYPLAKITTGGTVSSLSWVDIRPEAGGLSTLGSLTAAGYTQGSVLFVGPAGQVAENPGYFVWDDVLHKLTVGALRVASTADVEGRLNLPLATAVMGLRFASDAAAELTRSAAGTIRALGAVEAATSLAAPIVRSTVATGTAPLVVASATAVANLNADLVDGYHAGHATGQVPVADGAVNASLNADLVDGLHAGHATGQIPVSDGAVNVSLNAERLGGLTAQVAPNGTSVVARDGNGDVWARFLNASSGDAGTTPLRLYGQYGTNDYLYRFTAANVVAFLNALPSNGLNADLVDGYHAGHAAGQVPVSDGGVNTSLNADLVDGRHASLNADALTVAVRDGNGDVYARFINATNGGGVQSETPAGLIGYLGTDNYYRRFPPLTIRALIQTIDGVGSGIDADLLRGLIPGNASGNVAVANGTVVTNLNAHYLDNALPDVNASGSTIVQRTPQGYVQAAFLYAPGELRPSGEIPGHLSGRISSGDNYHRWYDGVSVLNMIKQFDGPGSGLDADYLDSRDAGNGSGQIPISNGAVNTNLNSQYLQGYDVAALATNWTNTGVAVVSTAPLTLTTGLQDVPGCVVSVSEQAQYLVIGTFLMDGINTGSGGENDNTLYGECATSYDGRQGGQAIVRVMASDGSRAPTFMTVTQTWLVTLRPSDTVRLRGYKQLATVAGAQIGVSHTRMVVLKMRVL